MPQDVGLARLRDGTELVRVGAPLRPEFAVWRYGDQSGRRRHVGAAVARPAFGGALHWIGPAIGFDATFVLDNCTWVAMALDGAEQLYLRRTVLTRIPVGGGDAEEALPVTRD